MKFMVETELMLKNSGTVKIDNRDYQNVEKGKI